ncbi:MAG: DUF4832 domain-containing protein [Streptococcus sp.]
MARRREKKSWSSRKKKLWLVICLIIITSGLYAIFVYLNTRNTGTKFEYTLSDKSFGNPLMGYVPSAEEKTVSEDVHLVYVDITWKELEPKKGHYNWETIEESNQFKRWKKEGKQVVLRFLLDYPGKSSHKDIPDWLGNEISDLGDAYSTSYGKGFSPNYQNKLLRKYYKDAVTAMGQRWGNDDFIAYIELGGLGHWGEWHVHSDVGIRQLPRKEVRKDYIAPFQPAFPKAKILMRRPFDTGLEGDFGIYNDVFGDKSATKTWLNWIQNGGSYDQTQEQAALKAMPKAWEKAPIGGELTSSQSMSTLLGNNLDELTDEAKAAHLTFLGPKVAEDIGDGQAAYKELLKHGLPPLGIRFENFQRESKVEITLNLENSGVAPLYGDWPVVLYLCNANGKVLQAQQLDCRLSKLLPDQTTELKASFAYSKDQNYQVKLGILSPMTQEPSVHFAMKGFEGEVMPKLATIQKDQKGTDK